MNSNLPFALIIGIENFGAKELAKELADKDINVVGVGEYVAGLSEINNFELLVDLSEVEGKFNYVFDFKGDSDLWETKQFKGEKITLICINDKEKAKELKNKLKDLDLNWRLVESYGVYGPGMEDVGFLSEAIKLAVVNKNLILPNLKSKFRILAIGDLIEAILRASFLSGTERENFLVLGKEINSEAVAKVLIDEAKMTRYKVFQKEIEIEKVDEEKLGESLKKLRWEPKIEFKDGVMETLQYFFSKADEESRKKKKTTNVAQITAIVEEEEKELVGEDKPVEKRERKKEIEVVVEEEKVEEKKSEEELEEIENFYKQKKISIEVEKVKPVEKIIKTRPIDEIIDQSFDDEFEEIKPMSTLVEKIETQLPVKEVEKEKKGFRWKLFWLFVAIFIVLVVPINWTISTLLAVNNIKQNINLIEAKKYDQVDILADKNLVRIEAIDQQIDDWGLNKLKIMRDYQSLLKVGEDALKMEKQAIGLSQSADLISQAIFKGRKIDFNDELGKEEQNLTEFESQSGIVLARLNGDFGWLPEKWRQSLQEKAQSLKEINDKLILVSKGIKILPEMLGTDGKERDYLVLFQNETELRATGGFIGSYGILSFKGGSLLNFDIKDVYEADGQLKGHVEPPMEIKTYLGEANWWLRDANWNPNFPDASNDLQWFLNQEVNKKVNGVIGINLEVAKSILGAVGDVYVPNFEKKINKDNLYQLAEYYAESKFFPGSAQKANFLGTLGGQLFEKIKDLKVKQQLDLVSALVDLLEKNEIQMAFNDQKVATMTNDLGWDGAIYQGKCLKDNCFSDYLFVVDSNFGVNKSNYFLNRNIEQTVDVEQNSVGRILKINYENTSKDSTFPGGDYKNYLRVYLPGDINLTQVSLIDGNDSNLKKVYSSDELRIRDVDGKKEIGFLATVPVMSKKTVEIRYSSQNNVMDKNKFSYLNYTQKQSGFGDTGIVTLVSFPNNWQPTQVEPQASMVGGKLLFNQILDKDIKMGVELEK
jgi:hypothetical protein